MRKNGCDQLGLGGFKTAGNGKALDQFSDFRANHMRAKQFSGRGVKNGFNKPRIIA